ncbi:hypothetical protein [Photorhabdus heterorhabditis]|uniref:hypothetical protein n=1 Tax=Photorhabdus heterorhabditis TaxID=880156 RepID=UPI0006C88599|nr:hypothetical protein [Photorhabdus heterorhabditis]
MAILSVIKHLLRQDSQVALPIQQTLEKNDLARMQLMICRNAIIDRLHKYGFIEVAVLIEFLKAFCDDVPDRASYFYIKEKLKECLDIHDNGSDYFYDMHGLLMDVEHIIAIEGPLL